MRPAAPAAEARLFGREAFPLSRLQPASTRAHDESHHNRADRAIGKAIMTREKMV